MKIRVLESVMSFKKQFLKEETLHLYDEKRNIRSSILFLCLSSNAEIISIKRINGRWKKRKGFVARPMSKVSKICL